MACTAAIEDEIDAHYSEQLAELGDSDPPLSASIERFQADERAHRDAAIAAGAEASFGYPLLYAAIRAGCRVAIELVEEDLKACALPCLAVAASSPCLPRLGAAARRRRCPGAQAAAPPSRASTR